MSSLYYGCSPYLSRNRKKKSLFKKRSSRGFVTSQRASVQRQRTGGGNFLRSGKMATKSLVFGLAKTGAAVKEGTESVQKAVQVAKNIKSGKVKFEIGPASLILGLIMISVTMSLVYLAHYNSVATKGYDLRRLEADRQQLMTQYDIKNMKLAEAKALATISSSDKVGSMRRAADATFIQGATALASR